MKAFLSSHWEKLAAAAGLLLLAASSAMTFLQGGPPPVVDETGTLMGTLRDLEKNAVPEVLTAPKSSEAVRALLERRLAPFKIPAGLVNYGATDVGGETHRFVVEEERVLLAKAAFDSFKVQGGDREVAEMTRVDDLHLRVAARKAGAVDVELTLGGRIVGKMKILARAKDRIELWPPVLRKPEANPEMPGEVSLSWEDDPRTAAQVTLGYVVERRSPPGSGEFKPVGALEGGRMLPPSVKRWVDEVEPNRRYEYRVRSVGDPSVTQVMPE